MMLINLQKKHQFYLFTVIFLSFLLRLVFLGQHDLLVEEAYYWNYAIHLDFGYLDHPPMIAVLIRLSTWLFGTNEFAVRCPALLCWMITTYYSYQWCELIQKGTGVFAVLLLSILPFFFLYSMVMTPDLPLMATWSAALYYLYSALCRQKLSAWYGVGIALGLGLLSKYSIVLVAFITFLFLLFSTPHRHWFRRKEPYIAALIMLVLFTPVIYWNATHEWMSFAFQSTRRFQGKFYFSFHELLGLLVLFLTPIGCLGLLKLWKRSDLLPNTSTQSFIRYYSLIPLLVFGFFSFSREIKLNWIGPSTLALIPWLSILMNQRLHILRQWFYLSPFLIASYATLFICVTFGQPVFLNQLFFNKMISWKALTDDLYQIATKIAATGDTPVFVPLDTYSIASELVFYQTKQALAHPERTPFLIHDATLFDFDGLMFKEWNRFPLNNKKIILIGKEKRSFNNNEITALTTPLSPIQILWGESQGQGEKIRPFYFRIIRMI